MVISLVRLLFGRLKYSQEFVGTTVKMENGAEYQIFRHIKSIHQNNDYQRSVFIVSFKFARLSYKANKFVSQFPMLLITGFPGFQTKMYADNKENGYWLGMYQWESKRALEEYKKSFVLKVMNWRAIDSSVKYLEFDTHLLNNYIEENKIE